MSKSEETQPRPFSRAAIASVVSGVACISVFGLLAIPLGIVGLIKTRGARRRGRAAAKWGIFLGGLALLVNLSGCPFAFLPPPVLHEDRVFASFLEDLAAGRYDAANAEVLVSDNLSSSGSARWADAFNAHHGRGRIVWLAVRTIGAGGAAVYYVHFERSGLGTVTVYSHPAGKWFFAVPLDSPHPSHLRYRDEYETDPDFRAWVDERDTVTTSTARDDRFPAPAPPATGGDQTERTTAAHQADPHSKDAAALINDQIDHFNATRRSDMGIAPIASRAHSVIYDARTDSVGCLDQNGHTFLTLTRQEDGNFGGELQVEFHQPTNQDRHSWGHVTAEFHLSAAAVGLPGAAVP